MGVDPTRGAEPRRQSATWLWSSRDSGRITVSPETAAILGLTLPASSGNFALSVPDYCALCAAEDLDQLRDHLGDAIADGRGFTFTHGLARLPDRVELHVHPFGEDEFGPEYLVGTVRSVAPPATQPSSASLAAHAQIVRGSGAASLVFDLDGTIRAANPRATELLGVVHVVGSDLARSLPELLTLGQAASTRGEVHHEGEAWCFELYRPPWAEGSIVATGVAAPQVSVAPAQQMAPPDIERGANENRTAFVKSVSHELRTPLNAVLGFVQLLSDTALDDEQREHVSALQGSTRNLLKLIDDVLEMTRLQAAGFIGSTEVFAVRDLADELIDLLRRKTRAKGVVLSSWVDDNVPRAIRADRVHIRRILWHLLNNSLRFTQDGRIQLHVRTKQAGGSKATRLIFEVRDTGAGIPSEDLQRIFLPFEQVEARRAATGGAGLGLAISQELATRLGGTLEVSSQLGEGSVFRLECPVMIAESAAVHARRHVLRLEDTTAHEAFIVGGGPGDRGRLKELVMSLGLGATALPDIVQASEYLVKARRMVLLVWTRSAGLAEFLDELRSGANAALPVIGIGQPENAAIANQIDRILESDATRDQLGLALGSVLDAEIVWSDAQPLTLHPPPAGDSSGVSESVAGLPLELQTDLRKAAAGGFLDELQELLHSVREFDARLAERLGAMAENFDTEGLARGLRLDDATATED